MEAIDGGYLFNGYGPYVGAFLVKTDSEGNCPPLSSDISIVPMPTYVEVVDTLVVPYDTDAFTTDTTAESYDTNAVVTQIAP